MSVVVLAFGAVNIIGKRKAAVMPSSDTSHINSMASFCVNCGAHMEPGVAFCHNCGAKNTTDTSAPYSSETAYSSEYPYEDNTSYVTNPYYHDESYESAPMNGTAPTDESKPTSRLRITFKTKGWLKYLNYNLDKMQIYIYGEIEW